MRKPNSRSLTIVFILLALLVAGLASPFRSVQAMGLELLASFTPDKVRESKIEPDVRAAVASMDDADMITVIVTMRSQANTANIQANSRQELIEQVVGTLQNKANATQNHIRALLDSGKISGEVADYESFWVFNGLVVTAKASVIEELAARPEVATISPNEIVVIEAASPAFSTLLSIPEQNLSVVGAPSLWDLGYQGQGIVVANLDSGVDVSHPELFTRWRGGNNSWFDPYGEHPNTPIDYDGHGTWTMGVMVGGDLDGTAIGLAPEAQWIAAKIFDDNGDATAAAIHAAFQWVLDPDGNPGTPDTPHVVNNSWNFSSGACDLDFELDLQALRAVGILPVFAAGNAGPASGTSRSPANNPSAFAVGNTTDSDVVYFESSRGPSSCGEAETIYPELVAPGVDIKTADLFGQYTSATGTSLAAPHLSGALALLLSAYADLDALSQQEALLNAATDLGAVGPDNDYGYGRLDVLAAYLWLQDNGNPTPTPTSTPAENLALGKPVSVSSSQDSSHGGDQAVDGDYASYWQPKKARGKNAPESESIAVDLGGSSTIDEVILRWDENYFATSYEIELSDDGSAWTTMYVTSSGDGDVDSIPLGGSSAQYVRMTSTGWSDGVLRNWLREFEVMGFSGSAPPTDTPTPTATATDTPTPTGTPTPGNSPTPTDTPTPTSTATGTPTPTPSSTPSEQGTLHVGDLDGSSRKMGKNWKATVTIFVHDGDEMPLSNASVTGSWSGGFQGTDSCVTNGNGQCSLSTEKIDGQQASAAFSVEDVSLALYSYQSAANHDADGDSNGTIITVSRP